MPKIPSTNGRNGYQGGQEKAPDGLRPLVFHGLEFGAPSGDQAEADCPLCGKERKLRANIKSGLWGCLSCGSGGKTDGNPLGFCRLLWASAEGHDIEALPALADHRKLLSYETLTAWGVRVSPISGEWLLPGWGTDGTLQQLYRYVQMPDGAWKVLATPTLHQQLFGPVGFNVKDHDAVWLCEGPWDGMALWEVLQAKGDKGLVLSVPSCTVFREHWSTAFRGREVRVCFDSDHPKVHPKTGKQVGLQGWNGCLRAAALLRHATPRVKVLRWGPDGHDPDHPSGWDVRDHLSAGASPRERVALAGQLEGMLIDAPTDAGGVIATNGDGGEADCIPCTSWKELTNEWRKAMKWDEPGEGLDALLSVCLASILTTESRGPKIWVLAMGPPSSGKTEICDGLSVNQKYTIAKSVIRGFHSGFDTSGQGEDDNSLLRLMLGKTLVTKEGLALVQAPNKDQIMGEARDIFDGKTSVHYRNKIDRSWKDIATGWILAGTAAMRQSLDSSDMGERFVRVMLNSIDHQTEKEIGWMSLCRTDDEACYMLGDELPEEHSGKSMDRAKGMTGGYVGWLREHARELLKAIQFDDRQKEQCQNYGWFAAFMRSRPSPRQDETEERERHYRLSNQMVKLARALAAVMNRPSVDERVMKVVRKVALDTSAGRTMEIAHHLHRSGTNGLPLESIVSLTARDGEKQGKLVSYMRKIGAVERHVVSSMLKSAPRWRLSPKMQELYKEIDGAEDSR